MKTVVTHTSPDQDALCAAWMVTRFFPGWGEARLAFVPAGKTLDGMGPDDQPDVLHVDTGLGRFDHHQTNDRAVCSASLVLAEIERNKWVKDQADLTALRRIVAVVLEVDHAGEKLWPDPAADRYEFFLEPVLDGLKSASRRRNNEQLLAFGFEAFDGIFAEMKSKAVAATILERGREFISPWGRGIAVETTNDLVMSLGERLGYMVVVKKDPQRGNVRIYAHPSSGADLTATYERIHGKDPDSDWFLHASKRLLLNGSSKNPAMRPTTLTLKEVVEMMTARIG